jgi:hypothetical protein
MGDVNETVLSGLRAWQDGDLDALAVVLDPAVELLWYEAGELDCHGKEEVLALLEGRKGEGRSPFSLNIEQVGTGYFVVTATNPNQLPGPDNAGAATLVTVRNGLVVLMRQFRSRDEAVAAADAAA